MSVHQDRRDSSSQRIPFEAIVEIGGELAPGSAFEAQSVDLSVAGMHLRTAYLPEVGQPLLCRFGSGAQEISADAEVVWRKEETRGGEFGIRFTNLDGASAGALWEMCGVGRGGPFDEAAVTARAEAAPGTRVRLHIEGLGSPMKARVRGATDTELLVGSNLEFLRVGRRIELEDCDKGGRRPAHIDRVDVEMDRDTRVPQLVVTLRYDDCRTPEGTTRERDGAASAASPAAAGSSPRSAQAYEAAPIAAVAGQATRTASETEAEVELELVERMHDRLLAAARKFGSGAVRWTDRARNTAALLWGKAAPRFVAREVAKVRRTTSPPPTGALHAAGKRVVRDSVADESDVREGAVKSRRIGKKGMAAIAASVALVAILVLALVHRSAPRSAAVSAGGQNGATAAATAAVANAPAPVAQAPAPAGEASGAQVAGGSAALAANGTAPVATAGSPPGAPPIEAVDDKKSPAAAEATSVTTSAVSFGHGKVLHPRIIQVKMDGPVTTMHGVRSQAGFTLTVPGRRTMETGGAIAKVDARIASVKVTNVAKASELTFQFRDNLPAFRVRAKGDHLQIAIDDESAHASHPVAQRTTPEERSRSDERHHSTTQRAPTEAPTAVTPRANHLRSRSSARKTDDAVRPRKTDSRTQI